MFRIRCGIADVARRVDALFGACRTEAGGPVDLELDVTFDEAAGAYVLDASRDELCRSSAPDELLEWISWIVNRTATERSTGLVLHAAAADALRAQP